VADFAALLETSPDDRAKALAEADRSAVSSDREVRAASAEAIAALGTPAEARATLTRLTQDSDVGVRYAAIAAAAGTPWRWRFELLAKGLEDDDLGVVAVAADGLSYAGDQRAAPVLRRMVTEKRLRFGAMEGLYALHDPGLPAICKRLFASFFTPFFEKALAALVLAREGDTEAQTFLFARVSKKYGEERNFIVANLATAAPVDGRARVEAIARAPEDASCETALLALTRLDAGWWSQAQEAIGRNVESDPHAAGELLLGLFDIDWQRAELIAQAHVTRDGQLGVAARKARLAAALRSTSPGEVQLRCD
jgi:HEAT repeat protein